MSERPALPALAWWRGGLERRTGGGASESGGGFTSPKRGGVGGSSWRAVGRRASGPPGIRQLARNPLKQEGVRGTGG